MNVFLILDEFKARVYSDIVTVSVSICLNIRNTYRNEKRGTKDFP